MKTIYLLIAALSFALGGFANAETVLHISANTPVAMDTPLTAMVHVNWVLERTGQNALTGDCNPSVTLKNGLGLYKTPSALNIELEQSVLDYMDTSHGVTSFNAVYLQGGFTGSIL